MSTPKAKILSPKAKASTPKAKASTPKAKASPKPKATATKKPSSLPVPVMQMILDAIAAAKQPRGVSRSKIHKSILEAHKEVKQNALYPALERRTFKSALEKGILLKTGPQSYRLSKTTAAAKKES
eukprot:Filipodium_phascolosomae@DN2619_c0_g1_i1.p1